MNLPDTLPEKEQDKHDPYKFFEHECIQGIKKYAKEHAFVDSEESHKLRHKIMRESVNYAYLLLSERKDKEDEDDAFSRLQDMAEKEKKADKNV